MFSTRLGSIPITFRKGRWTIPIAHDLHGHRGIIYFLAALTLSFAKVEAHAEVRQVLSYSA